MVHLICSIAHNLEMCLIYMYWSRWDNLQSGVYVLLIVYVLFDFSTITTLE